MSNNPDKNKPEKNNPSQSKGKKDPESQIKPNQNTLKFSDIPVNNEDSKSLETLFLPQQSSDKVVKIFLVDLLAVNNQSPFSHPKIQVQTQCVNKYLVLQKVQ